MFDYHQSKYFSIVSEDKYYFCQEKETNQRKIWPRPFHVMHFILILLDVM